MNYNYLINCTCLLKLKVLIQIKHSETRKPLTPIHKKNVRIVYAKFNLVKITEPLKMI